jgi:hypothetical protein
LPSSGLLSHNPDEISHRQIDVNQMEPPLGSYVTDDVIHAIVRRIAMNGYLEVCRVFVCGAFST